MNGLIVAVSDLKMFAKANIYQPGIAAQWSEYITKCDLSPSNGL